MHRILCLGVLVAVSDARATPQLATPQHASDGELAAPQDPTPSRIKPPAPSGRLVYANDDDWDWTAAGLLPAGFDAPTDNNIRPVVTHFSRGGARRSALVINCCFDRYNPSATYERPPGEPANQRAAVDVAALERVLASGGDVVLLDDGDELAPIALALIERKLGGSKCATLAATDIKWVDGRTRSLIPNRALERLAECVHARTLQIFRDTGTPGRVLVVEGRGRTLAR